MRFSARKIPNRPLAGREQLMIEHQHAEPLRKLFPEIHQLRIELFFTDLKTHFPQPSSQLRTLFAAAPAFFRFPCPCADCDGDFDLTDAVTAMITGPTGRKRAASITGHLSCQGVRFRDHAALHSSCAMQLSFQLLSEPSRAITDPAGCMPPIAVSCR
jgi:hypothetical protein